MSQSPCATARTPSSSVQVARSSLYSWQVLARAHTHLARSQYANCPSLHRNLKAALVLAVALEQVGLEVPVRLGSNREDPPSTVFLRTFTSQFDISWRASTLPASAQSHALVVSVAISGPLSATSRPPCTQLLDSRSSQWDHLWTLISIHTAFA